MQSISKYNKGFPFLLCDIDIYAWFVPLKDKNVLQLLMLFKILDESNWKSDKIWVNKVSEFYKRSVKSWLQANDIEMHSTRNGGKPLFTERFIRSLKNKMYKYMTLVSKMRLLMN